MPNIFDKITNSMPPPRQADADKLKKLEQERAGADLQNKPVFAKLPIKDMVVAWQKDPSRENTSILLNKLQPTIKSAINSYAQGMENELSVQAAKLALSTLKTYDPDFGTEPSTYVFHGLKRLNRTAADRTQIVKYPEQLLADSSRLKKIMADFEDDHGREPSLGELADKLGMSKKRIERIMEMPGVVNDSSMVSDDTGDNLLGKKDVTDDDYFEYVYNSVGPVDQKIMEWTSGMHGKQQLSNNDIAKKLSMSAAAISQRKNRIQSMLSEVRGLV